MTTIHSPAKGFTGKTSFGPLVIEFENGKATIKDLPDGVRQYLLRAGYTVGSTTAPQPEPVPLVDARDFAEQQVVGTKLRDAAVNPKPGDFLAPTNAGKADPHGPDVVSPGIHALQGVRPIKPGPVHVDDTDKQDAAETSHAVASTDGTPIEAAPKAEKSAAKKAASKPKA
jgi:hypothetical protein